MGQTESTEGTQVPPCTENVSIQPSSNNNEISNYILRKNFSNLESYSLQSTFENLSSVKNGREVIEEEVFVQYLGFPDEIGIGPILYRSFAYLASYPSPAHEENPLTYEGLVKAIAIYCDKVHGVIPEDRVKLIFESYAIHEEHSALGITSKTGVSYEVVGKQPSNTDDIKSEDSNVREGGITDVGSLKIDFINLDDDAAFLKALGFQQQKDDEPSIVSKVLCTEMIEILTGLIWLMINENTFTIEEFELSADINQIRKVVTPIVEHMARYDADLRNLPSSQILSSQTYIKWPIFKVFLQRNIPNVFNLFKPFFYGQFLIGQTLSQNRQEPIKTGPHMPKLDEKSECLSPINLALLSLSLSENVLNRKEWNCLYLGSKHGFSMNRFSTHVFKYTGPTLMLIRAELKNNHKQVSQDTSPSKKEILVIGAYISERWRSISSPRTCFGSAECYLFELSPTFELFPASHNNTNYVYYNPAFGIGFGGIATSGPTSSKIESMDINSFVIQLDNTLQYGRYRNDAFRDMVATYDLSVTRPFFDMSFEVLEIEVIGMGGEGVKEKQKKDWKWEEQESIKRTTTRKEVVDKEILKMAGIINEDQLSEIARKEP
ncbi:TLD-domain-containing protein [Glomus cerebriforme]|uniref:Restriction of telomere capping protein 5 n=1 Tax=Glomus cerebriforme TaxID=658196 RepID=A0A397SZU7_9GLOM|nr:TLD-domain-containing protein [Glomus cerebriforme]